MIKTQTSPLDQRELPQPHLFNGKVSIRSYMAPEHLWSARHTTRLCREIEKREEATGIINRPHRSYAISAVLSSVAFLESYINEILQDVADSPRGELNSRCVGISEQSALPLADTPRVHVWRR